MSECASGDSRRLPVDSFSLDRILQNFNAPISEEQAWALCYTFAVQYLSLNASDRNKLVLVSSLEDIILHKEGYIHPRTFLPGEKDRSSQKNASEAKMVTEFGAILYQALDYSCACHVERDLSPPLNRLIDLMTSSETERGETDDEGIEKDSGESGDEHDSDCAFTIRQVLEACEGHITAEGVLKGVEEHYRAVVRALVAESVDLTSFLQKVAQGTQFASTHPELLSSEHDLHMLRRNDWATFWQQVMQDLREGVKLKKIEYTKTPLEYALTPYEMLMEDIRSRRYTLNKVMINGSIPRRVKKDAHTIILDFIRSRPPLKNARDRKLPPPKKTECPIELLMESIKQSDINQLRHVVTPIRRRPISPVESCVHEGKTQKITAITGRKLIAAPLLNLSAEEDDDDLSDVPPSSPTLNGDSILRGPLSTHTYASRNGSPCNSSGNIPTSPYSRVAHDLVKYGKSNAPIRRHSISICQTPMVLSISGGSTPNASLPPSRGSPRSSTSSQNQYLLCSSQMQKDFLSSCHFSTGLDCLSLTLEEVVHIRNVLTKAELEALPLDLSIKDDVTKGKMCFLCMKTKFGFFAPRGRECRLCKRIVCKKCVTKMRIPTEHFSNIPVAMLTPQALSPRDDEQQPSSFSRAFLTMIQDFHGPGHERKSSCGSVGSAPSSPASSRKGSTLNTTLQPPAPCITKDIKKRGFLQRSATFGSTHRSMFAKEDIRQRTQQIEEQLRGELMAVCLDCKSMVLHVLRSIKHRKEQQHSPADSRLHLRLDLTPVYDQDF